jgi:hypothetical protein
MGYYMRFISDDEKDITLSFIETALREIDSNYAIDRDTETDSEGDLMYDGGVYGEIEVNRPGDGLFDEEIGELKECAENAEGEHKEKVLTLLNRSRTLVAVRVLHQGRSDEETFQKLDLLWEMLFRHRSGLMQADADGYYDASGLILEVE